MSVKNNHVVCYISISITAQQRRDGDLLSGNPAGAFPTRRFHLACIIIRIIFLLYLYDKIRICIIVEPDRKRESSPHSLLIYAERLQRCARARCIIILGIQSDRVINYCLRKRCCDNIYYYVTKNQK